MADIYRWSLSEMQTLQDYTKTAYETLNTMLQSIESVIADIESDMTWSGEYKVAFTAWLNLIQIYHAKLASNLIGEAAANTLSTFTKRLGSFYVESSAMTKLEGIG